VIGLLVMLCATTAIARAILRRRPWSRYERAWEAQRRAFNRSVESRKVRS
jgi:hypothetical protein